MINKTKKKLSSFISEKFLPFFLNNQRYNKVKIKHLLKKFCYLEK